MHDDVPPLHTALSVVDRAEREALIQQGAAILWDPTLERALRTDPAQALEDSLRYVHQKQEQLLEEKRAHYQLLASHSTAEGAPPLTQIAGGRESLARLHHADRLYRLALRDWARVSVSIAFDDHARTPRTDDARRD